MKPGVKEIAQQAGVAISTVSHVLNGTAPISVEVRDRVLQIARDVGYLERRRLKATISTLTHIGVVLPDAHTPGLAETDVLAGLQRECERRSIRLSILPGMDHSVDLSALCELMRANPPDGLLVIPDRQPATLARLEKLGVPVVLLNACDPDMALDSVCPAYDVALRAATRYLISLNHRSIVHLVARNGTPCQDLAPPAIRAAYEAAGLLPPDHMMKLIEEDSAEVTRKTLTAWLGEARETLGLTALVCTSPEITEGAELAFKDLGLTAPRDISLVGFISQPLDQDDLPAMTCATIPWLGLGPTAISCLEQKVLISQGQFPRVARIELAGHFHEGDTTATV